MGQIQQAEIDRPIRLRLPAGEALPATLVSFSYLTADDGSVNAESVIEVDRAGYERVDLGHLFHLLPEVRGPGSATFDPPAAVRIELHLKSMLVPQLFAFAQHPGAAGNRLADLSAEGNSVLLDTESWYARRVTADAEQPVGLDAELRIGYRTAWTADDDIFSAGPADPSDAAISMGSDMLAVVRAALDQRGWEYRQIPHRAAIGWKVRSEHGAWECYAIVDEQPGLLLLYSVLAAIVPADRRDAAAVLLVRLNQGLPVGNWELDFETGNLRYKASIDVGAGELTTALFERLMDRNLDIVAAHQPAVEGFAGGRLELEAALALSGEV